jgi:hypothetical protein
MSVEVPLSVVVGMEFEQSGGGGFGDDTVAERTAEEIRKDGENVELHGAAALVAVQLEQTVGQGGPDEPVGWIDDRADGPGEGDERTGFELNEIGAGHFEGGGDDAQRGAGRVVDNGTARQVGEIVLPGGERGPLGERDPHFAATEAFGVGDGVDAGEFEDQLILMEPGFLDREGPQLLLGGIEQDHLT